MQQKSTHISFENLVCPSPPSVRFGLCPGLFNAFVNKHVVLFGYSIGTWPFGEVMCAVWIFFDYGMTFASVFTLVVISLDRCVVTATSSLHAITDLKLLKY